MKLRLAALALSLSAVVVVTSSCKDKESAADAKEGGAGSAAPEGSAAASAVASAAPEAKASPAQDVTIDQFVAKGPPAACKTITSCKNDKVKVVVTMPIMLVAGFGTLDKPELGKELKAVDTSMKAEKRFTPSESECTTLSGIALKVLGIDGESLKAKIDKTISYDAKKAAACLDALATAPEACAQETKLATEPKMKEMEAFDKELKPSMEAYLKPCEGVIEGLVDEGGACESDVECKGKGAKCKAAGGAKAKDAKAKDAKAKTCTAAKR
ncbi:MAG: hypothetical protein KF819_16385 [Labilithrix sp.]|nr:hypothetical protein [Labilithrix sp.]